MITEYKEKIYDDRKIIIFIHNETQYTKEIFSDGSVVYWGYDFSSSEGYMINNRHEKELETELKRYYREKKFERII